MMDTFKETFREEAFELLTQLEDTLLELENSPADEELINAAFRAIHTIKGSSSMFGYELVSKFAHEIESTLERCRAGELGIDKEFIGLMLEARDHIRLLLSVDETEEAELAQAGEPILLRFRTYSAKAAGHARQPDQDGLAAPSQPSPASAAACKPAAPQESRPGSAADPARIVSYRIMFKPKPGIFKNGTRVLNLVEELAGLGSADLFPHTEDIPELESLDPESCHCAWDIIISTDRGENALRDVFIFVEDDATIDLSVIDCDEALRETRRLGQILIERGAASPEDVREALGSQKKLGEVLIEKRLLSRPQVESALVEQEHLKKLHEKTDASLASVRVSSEKLDGLVDLVGELVTLQARLSRTSLDLEHPALASIAEQFERFISQLRDVSMGMRMLPIGSTFNKFRRLVRDLSIELGKEAELVTEGADTELDKTVIEKLGDPLVHIIRNSLDHGIETPQLRDQAGKPRVGTIRLGARHSGAHVLIEISDDGSGLDRGAIMRKAVERGLASPGQELPDQDVYQFIFAPGFSTSKTLSAVSGRGVGMDVVKRAIEALGGSVQLSTEPGRSTCVVLKLPLTLAIIEGLLVRVDREFYVIPLSSVDGCIEISRDEMEQKGERSLVEYRGEFVPYVRLRRFFSCPGEDRGLSQMVIASAQDRRVGLVVDQIIGDYQTVIKPLGRMFRQAQGLSGATILGDGAVALILDVNRLSSLVQGERARKAPVQA